MALDLATTTRGGQIAPPSFAALLRGEIFKLSRLFAFWWTGGGFVLLFGAVTVISAIATYYNASILSATDLLPAYYTVTRGLLENLRGLSGLVMIVLTVTAIAQEYRMGTIRVLVARGVGRVRLIGAKLVALLLFGLLVEGVMLTLGAAGNIVGLAAAKEPLGVIFAAPASFWGDLAVYLLTTVISLATTMLFAATVTILGRSQAFGLGIALPYFLVENIIQTVLLGISFATGNGLWFGVTRYFLGVNLTVMPAVLVSPQTLGNPIVAAAPPIPNIASLPPPIDGAHALLVTLVYALLFVGALVWLLRARDVKE